MAMIENSIKMDVLYRAVFHMIDWKVSLEINGDDEDQDRVNSLRRKYKKMMLLMIGKIPDAYIDHNVYYIALDDAPVIAALLIRVACDKDKRYGRFRAWLSEKYSKYPERYYPEIIEFNLEIEQMLDALYEKKIYISELESQLRKTYPDLVLSLPLHIKNKWETIIKDSIHYNEAMLLKTIIPLIHDIENYISFLPQVFDDGNFCKENYRTIKQNINFGEHRATLIDQSLLETSPLLELIKMGKYQEKCRSLFIQIIRAFWLHMFIHAAEKVQSMGNAEDYLTLLAAEMKYTPEQTDEFIDGFYSTQYDDIIVEEKKSADFIELSYLDIHRLYKMIDSDKTLCKILEESKSNKKDTLLKLRELSSCPKINEKEFSDTQEDESQASEETSKKSL